MELHELKIVEVVPEESKRFQSYIENRRADFFFFIYEYHHNYPGTRFWIATDGEKFNGAMYYNEAQTLRISGSPQATNGFLQKIDSIPRYITVQDESLNAVLKVFESEKRRLKMYRLIMAKQDLSISKPIRPRRLKAYDLPDALSVFQAADPEDWTSADPENMPFDDYNQWYGIEADGNLASVCWNQVYSHGSHVAFVATHPDFQNQGLATNLIKYALIESFKLTDFAVIHVREENIPALRCYEKIGYRKHFRFTTLCEPKMMYQH